MAAKTGQGPRYMARRGFGYFSRELDRGQVIQLTGEANDPGNERLIRLGYLQEVNSKDETYTCAECGAEFISGNARTGHGDARHRPQREGSPRDEDSRLDREEAMLNQVAPLYLENSKASQAA